MPDNAYYTEVNADTPSHWYQFVTDASDSVGTEDGTDISSPTYGLDPPLLNALSYVSLSGSSGAVRFGSTFADIFESGSWSVEFWLKWGGSSDQVPFSVGNTTTDSEFFMLRVNRDSSDTGTQTGTILARYTDGTGNHIAWSGALGLNDDDPHHIVVTSDGSTMTLYVDGSSVDSVSITATPSFDTAALGLLGRTSDALGFAGAATEMAVYESELAAARVSAHHGDIDTPYVAMTEVTAAAAPSTIYLAGNAAHATASRIYIAYLGDERDLYVTYYDKSTGTVATPVEVGTYPLTDSDDHGAPSLTVDDDGHIHVVWGSHNTVHKYSVSDNPNDISAWTTTDLDATAGTYPSIHHDPATNNLYVVDRAGNSHGSSFPAHEYAGIRVSTDGGSTWSSPTEIIDTTGSPESASDFYGYGRYFADGKLHLMWTVARGGGHDGTRTDLHYAYYNPSDGHMYNIDDTDLGTVITWSEHSDCLVVSDSPIHTGDLDINGTDILISWESLNGSTYEPKVTRWTGAAWSTSVPEYTPTFHQDDAAAYQTAYQADQWRAIFPYRGGDDSIGYSLGLWESGDGGASWDWVGKLAEESSENGWFRVDSGDGWVLAQTEISGAGYNQTLSLIEEEESAAGDTPSAPTNPAATAQSFSSILVTWDDVADETGYRVERSDDGSTGWTDVSGNLAADTTSYTDTGLDADTQYFYRIVAFNGDGDSDPSSVVNDTTLAVLVGSW